MTTCSGTTHGRWLIEDNRVQFSCLDSTFKDSIRYVPPYPNNTLAGVDYITSSTSNQPAMGRVRLGGGKHSRFKMRLRIYYSDL